MSDKRTVVPHKVIGQEYEEVTLAAETLPGTLVQITGAPHEYTGTKNGVRCQSCYIVYENELFGKNCRQAIAAGERAQVLALQKGMRCTPFVEASVAVAVNDLLVPNNDGKVDKYDSTENVTSPQLLIALEACAADATGDDRRILCRVLR